MSGAYFLYIDDSGSRHPDRRRALDRDDGMDCFALGGILINKADRAALTASHRAFCDRWKITYPLHSSSIRGRRREFSWLADDPAHTAEFFRDLERFLCALPVVGFATVIDREGYNLRYRERYGDKRWLMCKSAYAILIERVAKWVDAQGGIFEVRFEETGKNEDRAMIGYAKDLKRNGLPFDPEKSAKYDPLTAADFKRLVIDEPRRVTKQSPEIQIADLYLYPMIKAGYTLSYAPYQILMKNSRVIDALLSEDEIIKRGIKYSCFDAKKRKA